MFRANRYPARVLLQSLPLAFVFAGPAPILAQPQAAPAAPRAFEVASVKPTPPGSLQRGMSMSRTEVRWQGQSVKDYIKSAYAVKDYSLSGPSWLDAARFDIEAKLPAGADAKEFPAMLQTLLAERFKLAAHRESQIVNGYVLVVDKKGPGIRPVEPDPHGGSMTGYRARIVMKSSSMTQFADVLESYLQRPVIEQTGLEGVYNLSVEWLADDAPLTADGASATTIFIAVEQLGLRLQAGKVPIRVLVVDHVERSPSEN
jgi:uncharacterized protein (TIGR03435 family)